MTEDAILTEAEQLLADGSPAGAERVLTKAWPNRSTAPPDALHLWGAIRFAEGKASEAEGFLRNAVAAEPESLRHHIALGHVLSRQGNHDEAAQFYTNALNINDTWPGLHLVYAMACYRSGRYENAEQGARAGLNREPNIQLWDTLSCALRGQGRYAEAVAAAEQGIKTFGEDAALQHSRAAALLRLKRFKEALEIFDKLAAAGVVAPALSLYRGQALDGLKRPKEAAKIWAEALARWPDSIALQRAYASVSRN